MCQYQSLTFVWTVIESNHEPYLVKIYVFLQQVIYFHALFQLAIYYYVFYGPEIYCSSFDQEAFFAVF